MNEKVSIIIPTYKGSAKIAKTIDGIERQTYHNTEIIVVDDNGIGTEEQIRTAMVIAQYTNIKYIIHEVNKNGSAARNTGITNSTGEYIAFLDDDDVWMENKIEEQASILYSLSNDWGAVYCPYMVIQSKREAYLMSGGQTGNILYDYLVEKSKIASSTVMIRRSVLEKVQGFDESFKRHQDWEFIARISAHYKISFTNKTLVFKHNEIRRNSPKKLEMIIKNRLYYLDKMDVVISQLSQKEQKAVYAYHYTFLAKECVRRKKIIESLKWLKKTERPILYGIKLFSDIIKYIYKKCNKHSPEVLLIKFQNQLKEIET